MERERERGRGAKGERGTQGEKGKEGRKVLLIKIFVLQEHTKGCCVYGFGCVVTCRD